MAVRKLESARASGWHGVGVGVAPGSGVGVGVGEGPGVGVGVGVGVAVVTGAGTVMTSPLADDDSVTFEPPVKAEISGVKSLKLPVTVTLTVLP